MSSIPLDLIAAMIQQGDVSPILKGEFRREHCTDNGAESLFDFILRYPQITQGQGRVPSLSVIRDRFPHIMLPVPAVQVDIPGLVYEVRASKTRLQIQELADKMLSALTATDPISELRAVRHSFDLVMRDSAPSRDLSFDDAALDILEDYQNKEILKSGLPWPWPAINDATQGMRMGEFYLIAGRPKSRKTFVALFIAAYLVRVHNARVLFISPEMPSRQVMLRFVAFLAAVPYTSFKKGDLKKEDEDALFETIGAMIDSMNLPGVIEAETDNEQFNYQEHASEEHRGSFVVAKATGQPITFVGSKIQEHRPHVVIVDSFYRLGAPGGKAYDSDWKAVSTVGRIMKDLAMEHSVVMIGTHQLNREAEDKVGSLANLGYSDAIGQEVDMALRVVTARRSTGDKSALIVLGARETDCEGVIINNVPCSNFSQIEPILASNREALLEDLMKREEANEAPTSDVPSGKVAKKSGSSTVRKGGTKTPELNPGVKDRSENTDLDPPEAAE